ncbi:hypothetical protein [Sorangium sp. So ce204]|uniref:hypothetical protein n=1 Tax=Sorangium sp. So ce204 TaxID=3133288 RepID=UPI003F60C783
MVKKVRASEGRSKAGGHGNGEVKRFRVGPEEIRSDDPEEVETWAHARLTASTDAEAAGELVADLPAIVGQTPDGNELRIQARPALHPAMVDLKRLTREFYELAIQHANPDAVPVMHILHAVCDAVEKGDYAALRAPDKWARDRLRPPPGSAGRFGFLPLEDSMRRPLDIAQLSGGFHMLASLIRVEIEKFRANTATLEGMATQITACMAHNFPSIPSLSRDPDVFKRQGQIGVRVREALLAVSETLSGERSESLGQTIAERLLRKELELSGKSRSEIRKAFKFLDHKPRSR